MFLLLFLTFGLAFGHDQQMALDLVDNLMMKTLGSSDCMLINDLEFSLGSHSFMTVSIDARSLSLEYGRLESYLTIIKYLNYLS